MPEWRQWSRVSAVKAEVRGSVAGATVTWVSPVRNASRVSPPAAGSRARMASSSVTSGPAIATGVMTPSGVVRT